MVLFTLLWVYVSFKTVVLVLLRSIANNSSTNYSRTIRFSIRLEKQSAPSLQKHTVLDEAKPYSDLETYMTTNFPSIVGALIFPAITCRPDLSYEVSYAARSMHSATRMAITRLHHLLKYVCHHRHFCLKYYKTGGPSRKYLND